jgi:hypothetical protein
VCLKCVFGSFPDKRTSRDNQQTVTTLSNLFQSAIIHTVKAITLDIQVPHAS